MSAFTDYPVSSALLEWAEKSEIKTLTDVFKNSLEKFGDRPYLGDCDGKGFRFKTYGDVYAEIKNFACALLALGLRRTERVANFSVNGLAWPVVDFGTMFAGGIHVPMYPTLSAEEMAYIVEDSEAQVLIASHKEQILKVLECLRKGRISKVKHIIAVESFSFESEYFENRVRLWNWQKFLDFGADKLKDCEAAMEEICASTKAEDICSFVYTSGTTGNPKGAMLMHGNFVSQVVSLSDLVGLNEDDVEMSFLPLSHVFERICYYALTYKGSSIGYTRGIRFLTADLKLLKPTMVPSVPRLFEKIFAKLVAQSGGGLKDRLFNHAINIGRRYREEKKKGKVSWIMRWEHSLCDALIYSKIREAVGGRVRYFISGGAPSRVDVLNFFLDAGLCILEGYGLTETSPVLCLNRPENINPGTVGEATPGVEIKLAEDGELCAKGPNIMRGYFKLTEATAEVFDADGYFHTGDIGEYDPETKCYTITDRKKEILVLSNGKKVAPAPLENAIKASFWIEQVVVVGNNCSFVGALIVPNFAKLEEWAKKEGLKADREALVKEVKVEQLLLREIKSCCSDFSDYEKVRRIVVLPRALSAEEGEVTPTLKIKRRVVNAHFRELIEGLYQRDN